MTDATSCKSEKTVIQERLYCSACTRDYVLYRIKHVCNPILPCERMGRKKYTEEYYADLVVAKAALCDQCSTAQAKLTTARKCVCPLCDYTGWYVHSDDDKRCPACRVVPEAPVRIARPAPPAKVVKAVDTPPPKPTVYLYLRIDKSFRSEFDWITAPADARPEWFAAAGLLPGTTGPWTNTWCAEKRDCETYDQFYTDTMRELSKFLAALRETHQIVWRVSNGSQGVLWLMYLYQKFSPAGAEPLGLV